MPGFVDGRACLLKPGNDVPLTANSPEAYAALRILLLYDGENRRRVGKRVPADVIGLWTL